MKTILSTNAEEFKAVQKESEEMQRYKYFSGKLEKLYFEKSCIIDDTRLMYAECNYKPRFNKKLFWLLTNQKGFSFDKVTKKLKLWFGTNFIALDVAQLNKFFKLIGCEWITQARLHHFLTKGLMEKILIGKITNPREACGYIIKMNRFPKNTSIKFLMDWIWERGDRQLLYCSLYTAKNVNHFLTATQK